MAGFGGVYHNISTTGENKTEISSQIFLWSGRNNVNMDETRNAVIS
jgi:hypothetical protein